MRQKRNRNIKLWLIMMVAVLFWTIGSGFYRDSSADGKETYKGLKLFTEVIQMIEDNYVDPVDSEKLIEKAIEGMVNSLDPHSQLLPPEAFEELQVDTKGEFDGIGISITMKQGLPTVIAPIEGTPAYKAGIQAGDIIIKVDGEATKDMMLWEAVQKMRGPRGTSVLITVLREGEAEPLEFSIIRDIIPIDSVKYLSLQPGYGYIWITSFQENTAKDLENALKTLESGQSPLKGLVIDLRDNPGGLLDQSIEVADLFLEKGTIVSIKGRSEQHTKEFKAHPDKVKHSYPIVVLINGGSASASEIVAGALQDHHRALVLGSTSFGKGSVQTVATLKDGYGLKFTIARYYTPNGTSIQAQGIVPDILVKQRFFDDKETSRAEQIYLKEKDLKNHLDALPMNGDEEEHLPSDAIEDGTTDPESAPEEPGNKRILPHDLKDRHGPLNLEKLMTDNYVKRALDILVSYDIFKDLRT